MVVVVCGCVVLDFYPEPGGYRRQTLSVLQSCPCSALYLNADDITIFAMSGRLWEQKIANKQICSPRVPGTWAPWNLFTVCPPTLRRCLREHCDVGALENDCGSYADRPWYSMLLEKPDPADRKDAL